MRLPPQLAIPPGQRERLPFQAGRVFRIASSWEHQSDDLLGRETRMDGGRNTPPRNLTLPTAIDVGAVLDGQDEHNVLFLGDTVDDSEIASRCRMPAL